MKTPWGTASFYPLSAVKYKNRERTQTLNLSLSKGQKLSASFSVNRVFKKTEILVIETLSWIIGGDG